jgi:hypothetical protein
MSQTRRDKPVQPATVRAEELFDRMGQRIGYFTALAMQRIQRATTSIREEADRLNQPEPTPEEQSNGPAATRKEEARRLATAKAEEMVDRMGQRISQYTALAGLQILRAVARAREEAEDMWAEAQNIRRQNNRKLQ